MLSGQTKVVVERETNILAIEEAHQHEDEVRKAIYDELVRWNQRGGFKRFPKKQARNVLDSRWVLKWKKVDGMRVIKARLTARGFKDKQAEEVSTYAGDQQRLMMEVVLTIIPYICMTHLETDGMVILGVLLV